MGQFRAANSVIRVWLAVMLIGGVVNGCTCARVPKDPYWHQETCGSCGMMLTEPRYAVQLMTKQGPVYFDDMGCALAMVDKEDMYEYSQLYVRPHDGDDWVPAENVMFLGGLKTPMGHGFGAVLTGGELSFPEVVEQLRAKGESHNH